MELYTDLFPEAIYIKKSSVGTPVSVMGDIPNFDTYRPLFLSTSTNASSNTARRRASSVIDHTVSENKVRATPVGIPLCCAS